VRHRSRTRLGLVVALVALAVVVAAAIAVAGGHSQTAAKHPHKPAVAKSAQAKVHRRAPAQAPAVSPYLQPAITAYERSRAWWDPQAGWYRQFLPGRGQDTLATMWGIVHLFGATNALAIADPTPANIAAARSFADGAEAYWNPDLKPVPAYGPTPNNRGPDLRTWYDDEAWWGVAYFDAFRATGDQRFLTGADRSLTFIDSGWDPHGGGIYWDNRRTFRSSESLAGGTLTAAMLYQQTHETRYLDLAKKYIHWANRKLLGKDGLYGGRDSPAGPMPYVESPMAEAMLRLCQATGNQSWCTSGETLMRNAANHFKQLTMGPQYDAIYLRSVIEIYRIDHNPRWYRIAADAANEAMTHAADSQGLYLRMWNGRPIHSSIGTPPYKLQTHAATTSVLAWLATVQAPAGGAAPPPPPGG
jgi:hypothetical protein